MRKILLLLVLLLTAASASAAGLPNNQLRYTSLRTTGSSPKLSIVASANFGGLKISSHTVDQATGLCTITFSGELTTLGSFLAASDRQYLQAIELPASLTTIDSEAFSGCTGLAEVTADGNLATVGDRAFSGCSALTDFHPGTALTSIGAEAFRNCTRLQSIAFLGRVQTIGAGAFNSCVSLQEIDLGHSLRSIGAEAFRSTPSLTTVRCHAHTPPTLKTTASTTMFDDGATFRLYVPFPDVDAYAASWNIPAARISGTPFEVTFKASGPGLLEVEGQATAAKSHTVTVSEACRISVSAKASEGYSFIKWSDGKTAACRTFSFPADCVSGDVYTATFAVFTGYRLTAQPYVEGQGSVKAVIDGAMVGPVDDYPVEYASYVNLIATPAAGYRFLRWSDGATDASRNFSCEQGAASAAVSAYFVPTDLQPVIDAFAGEYEQMNGGSIVRCTFATDGSVQTVVNEGGTPTTTLMDLATDLIGVRTTPYGQLIHLEMRQDGTCRLMPFGVKREDGKSTLLLHGDLPMYPVDGSDLKEYAWGIDGVQYNRSYAPGLDAMTDARHASTALFCYHDRAEDLHLCLYNADLTADDAHNAISYQNTAYTDRCRNLIIECHGRNAISLGTPVTAISSTNTSLVFALPEATDTLFIGGSASTDAVSLLASADLPRNIIVRGKGTLRIVSPDAQSAMTVSGGGLTIEGGARVEIMAYNGVVASRQPATIDAASSLTVITDLDGNGVVELSEQQAVVNALLGLSAAYPSERLDANGDGRLTITDAARFVGYLLAPWPAVR